MTECHELHDQLSAYLDGELSVEERLIVDSHLSVCDACRTILGDLKFVSGSLSYLPMAKAPASFSLNVQTRISGQVCEPDLSAINILTSRARPSWASMLLGMAALISVGLLIFLLLPESSRRDDEHEVATASNEHRKNRVAGQIALADEPKKDTPSSTKIPVPALTRSASIPKEESLALQSKTMNENLKDLKSEKFTETTMLEPGSYGMQRKAARDEKADAKGNFYKSIGQTSKQDPQRGDAGAPLASALILDAKKPLVDSNDGKEQFNDRDNPEIIVCQTRDAKAFIAALRLVVDDGGGKLEVADAGAISGGGGAPHRADNKQTIEANASRFGLRSQDKAEKNLERESSNIEKSLDYVVRVLPEQRVVLLRSLRALSLNTPSGMNEDKRAPAAAPAMPLPNSPGGTDALLGSVLAEKKIKDADEGYATGKLKNAAASESADESVIYIHIDVLP